MPCWGMAQDICVIVSSEDRARLVAVIADRKRPHKHVLRARIIFHRVDRLPTAETARRAGVSRSGSVAVATALRRSRGGGIAARQDAASGQSAAAADHGGADPGAHLHRAAGHRDPMDRAGDRESGRCQPALSATYLGSSPATTASLAHLQAVHRSGFRCLQIRCRY
jgi:hypothetical protein